jgi:hypothetical protein
MYCTAQLSASQHTTARHIISQQQAQVGITSCSHRGNDPTLKILLNPESSSASRTRSTATLVCAATRILVWRGWPELLRLLPLLLPPATGPAAVAAAGTDGI